MQDDLNKDKFSALYRVYVCNECGHTGFGKIDAESDVIHCSDCAAEIRDDSRHVYVGTLKRALWAEQRILFHMHEDDQDWEGRALRNALNAFRVIERRWKKSHGKPLDVEVVVRECSASGTDEADSRAAIGWLDVDARITVRSGRIVEVSDTEVQRPSGNV